MSDDADDMLSHSSIKQQTTKAGKSTVSVGKNTTKLVTNEEDEYGEESKHCDPDEDDDGDNDMEDSQAALNRNI